MASSSCLPSNKTTSTISFKTTIIIFLQFQLWFGVWANYGWSSFQPGSVCMYENRWVRTTIVKCYIANIFWATSAEGDEEKGGRLGTDSLVMLTGSIEVKPFISETWIKTDCYCWFQKGSQQKEHAKRKRSSCCGSNIELFRYSCNSHVVSGQQLHDLSVVPMGQ